MKPINGTCYQKKIKSIPPVESVFAVFFIVMFALIGNIDNTVSNSHRPSYELQDTCRRVAVDEFDYYQPVYIDSKKKLWVGNILIEKPSQFHQRLKDLLWESKWSEKVYLLIDKSVYFGTVQDVMRLIKKAGIKDIVLITKERAALMDFGCKK